MIDLKIIVILYHGRQANYLYFYALKVPKTEFLILFSFFKYLNCPQLIVKELRAKQKRIKINTP